MEYQALKDSVGNQGEPPSDFLDELIAWGRVAPADIFADHLPETDAAHDIYLNVVVELGPWKDGNHRRAAMLEVMRVLAAFESSWDWNKGIDPGRDGNVPPATAEAGAWQVSYDSMGWGAELKTLAKDRVPLLSPTSFQVAMKSDHTLAMEYIARLLRRTTQHNGPINDREKVHPNLRRDAVAEFQRFLDEK